MSVRQMETKRGRISIAADPSKLAREGAQLFVRLAIENVAAKGLFTVALSGGSTPKLMFALLADEPFKSQVPWRSIGFFWGDERTVGPEHPDSNYRMSKETLLSKVNVSADNIFRIRGEDPDHDGAARDYSDTIRKFFSAEAPVDFPAFDLILLGMGPDGHTASLFPGSEALKVDDRICVANYVEKFDTWRITLSAREINQAAEIAFLVAGADKAATLHDVLEGPSQPELYPSQLIHPGSGNLVWMVDEAAAAQLVGRSRSE
jgi:6-phosphogluconolactonase